MWLVAGVALGLAVLAGGSGLVAGVGLGLLYAARLPRPVVVMGTERAVVPVVQAEPRPEPVAPVIRPEPVQHQEHQEQHQETAQEEPALVMAPDALVGRCSLDMEAGRLTLKGRRVRLTGMCAWDTRSASTLHLFSKWTVHDSVRCQFDSPLQDSHSLNNTYVSLEGVVAGFDLGQEDRRTVTLDHCRLTK